jgi:hypothetical protein
MGAVKSALAKEVDDQGNVYYTVFWSALRKADRYEIISSVPSVPGIFELYYQDEHKQMNLFFVSKAWYGGLRNWLRKATDATLEENPGRRKLLTDHDCYYRYVEISSYGDMSDVLFFFAETYFPHANRVQSSGRYPNIFVNEVSKEKIVSVE